MYRNHFSSKDIIELDPIATGDMDNVYIENLHSFTRLPDPSAGVFFENSTALKIINSENPESFLSKTGCVSLWFRRTAGFLDGNAVLIRNYTNDSNSWRVFINGTNNNVVFSAEVNDVFRSITSAGGVVNDTQWHHVAISWDTATGAEEIYIDGVDSFATTSFSADQLFSWTEVGTSVAIRFEDDGLPFTGDLAEVYITTQYVDLSKNISKFISGGLPVSLGADGSLPTGNQPKVYFSGPASSMNCGFNLGTWADATMIGNGVVDSADPPSV